MRTTCGLMFRCAGRIWFVRCALSCRILGLGLMWLGCSGGRIALRIVLTWPLLLRWLRWRRLSTRCWMLLWREPTLMMPLPAFGRLLASWVARFGYGALLFPDTLLWLTIFGVCQGGREYLDKPQKSLGQFNRRVGPECAGLSVWFC